jgi:hypothetical protein
MIAHIKKHQYPVFMRNQYKDLKQIKILLFPMRSKIYSQLPKNHQKMLIGRKRNSMDKLHNISIKLNRILIMNTK